MNQMQRIVHYTQERKKIREMLSLDNKDFC